VTAEEAEMEENSLGVVVEQMESFLDFFAEYHR
jgi:hypothetical protein